MRYGYHALVLFFFIQLPVTVKAGSGLYLGADIVNHGLDTSSVTTSTSSPTSYGKSSETFTEAGFRAGYKYKRRLTHRYYWAPELALTQLDNDLLYSTSLKLGYEFAPYEIYGLLGVSRVDKFTDNRLNYGLGLEYRLENHYSINVEWVGYDTIEEFTESTITIGTTTVDVRTDTQRSINTIRLGFTYYFQGSK